MAASTSSAGGSAADAAGSVRDMRSQPWTGLQAGFRAQSSSKASDESSYLGTTDPAPAPAPPLPPPHRRSTDHASLSASLGTNTTTTSTVSEDSDFHYRNSTVTFNVPSVGGSHRSSNSGGGVLHRVLGDKRKGGSKKKKKKQKVQQKQKKDNSKKGIIKGSGRQQSQAQRERRRRPPLRTMSSADSRQSSASVTSVIQIFDRDAEPTNQLMDDNEIRVVQHLLKAPTNDPNRRASLTLNTSMREGADVSVTVPVAPRTPHVSATRSMTQTQTSAATTATDTSAASTECSSQQRRQLMIGGAVTVLMLQGRPMCW